MTKNEKDMNNMNTTGFKTSEIKKGDEVMFGGIVEVGGVWLNGFYEVESVNGGKATLSGIAGTWPVKAFDYRIPQEAR